jgi:uncharacterized protein GlcG (DUF336 family)
MLHTLTSVSSDAAQGLVDRAVARARADGIGIAVAVVDAQGILLAFRRMDGVAPPVVDFATDKAFTAATLRRTTAAFGTDMTSAPAMALGAATRARLLAWGGGLPILKDGRCVGGIGVSGAKDVEDIACAAEALAAMGFDAVGG